MWQVMQTGCNEDVLEQARKLNRLRHSVLGAQKVTVKYLYLLCSVNEN